MKKTFIALLLVLAIVSVNVFADPELSTTATAGNTTTIKINAGVTGVALFGVSAGELNEDAFKSAEAFLNAVSKTITANLEGLASLKESTSVGWLSGFNTTNTAVSIGVSVSNLVATGNEDAAKIPLTVSPSGPFSIAKANEIAGTLDSTEIKVVAADPTQIDVAPAGTYTATVTFTVSGS